MNTVLISLNEWNCIYFRSLFKAPQLPPCCLLVLMRRADKQSFLHLISLRSDKLFGEEKTL